MTNLPELTTASYAATFRFARTSDPVIAAEYDHLAKVLHDLDCYFSERGITAEQRERLQKMGFPALQK